MNRVEEVTYCVTCKPVSAILIGSAGLLLLIVLVGATSFKVRGINQNITSRVALQLHKAAPNMPGVERAFLLGNQTECFAHNVDDTLPHDPAVQGYLRLSSNDRDEAAKNLLLTCLREHVLSAQSVDDLHARNKELEKYGIAPFKDNEIAAIESL